MKHKKDERKVLTMLKDTLEKLSEKKEVSRHDKEFIASALTKVIDKLALDSALQQKSEKDS